MLNMFITSLCFFLSRGIQNLSILLEHLLDYKIVEYHERNVQLNGQLPLRNFFHKQYGFTSKQYL
ncbi:hypothetical protein T11_13659 [Trichinella zimbabwensis]|uniref:Uncharacterized protein n=1 Tax=Trichinella zimbabwensis TaxID=268475 RepID=A0A0V1HU62_9BILA|nr:hypothetical protein T11_5684 [Trichinella zimbabwensis]KRZ14125.1 hypothetical protein T11_13659 [Trichinella zimbabwensis]